MIKHNLKDTPGIADAIHLSQSKESEAFVTFVTFDKNFIKSALKPSIIPVREP
jgi:hypothetical protein